MSIFSFFPELTLTKDQHEALVRIENFFASDKSIFILRGYAGSGKTTILKGVVDYLDSLDKDFILAAPTGKAAKVLAAKTKHPASTIHKAIYSKCCIVTKNEDSNDIAEREFKYVFPIKENEGEVIAIIDEASMLSNKESNNELFDFGTNRLLSDLMTFTRGGKMIFVGDNAQLPPVTDTKSLALDPYDVVEDASKVDFYEMTEIVRQASENMILKDATKVRRLLEVDSRHRDELVFETKENEVEVMQSADVVDRFCDDFMSAERISSSVICYSNADANRYNKEIRKQLYPDSDHVCPGDVLMIVQNNYNQNFDLYNGDIVKVITASDKVEKLSAPVYVKTAEGKKKIIVDMTFRDVEVQMENGSIIKCKIIDHLLNNNSRGLTIEEIKALYINFCMRHQGLKQGSTDFADKMLCDQYMNALRVKYGYAITGHKSQGSEWERVYVDYTGRLGLNNDCLRWIYTTTTRASKTLFGINMPNISALSDLSMDTIGKVGKAPADMYDWGDVDETDWHKKETSMPCKRAKCIEVENKLSATKYTIDQIKSNPYMEEYYIKSSDNIIRFDAMHNKAGMFRPFTTKDCSDEGREILEILNRKELFIPKLNYEPSVPSFEKLYQKMAAAAMDSDVTIVNIKEYAASYYITYFLKTSGEFSYIQFYFDGKNRVTHAMPKSDLGVDDEKLGLLISKLL